MNKIEKLKMLFDSGGTSQIIKIYSYLSPRILPEKSKTILYIARDNKAAEEIFSNKIQNVRNFKFAGKMQYSSGYSIITTSGDLIIIRDASWLFTHYAEIDSLKQLVFVL